MSDDMARTSDFLDSLANAFQNIAESSIGFISLGFIGLAAVLLIMSFLLASICLIFGDKNRILFASKYSKIMLIFSGFISLLHFAIIALDNKYLWKPGELPIQLGVHTATWDSELHGKLVVPDDHDIAEKNILLTVSENQKILIDGSSVIQKIADKDQHLRQLRIALTQRIAQESIQFRPNAPEARATLSGDGQ